MAEQPADDGDGEDEIKDVVGEEHLDPDVDQGVDEAVQGCHAGPERENDEVALVPKTWENKVELLYQGN